MERLTHLRWQLVATHLIVVVIAIATISLATRLIFLESVETFMTPALDSLVAAGTPAGINNATSRLLILFRDIVITSLIIGATIAILTTIIVTLWLSRLISKPLNQIAFASQRIASGRYDERVIAPSRSNELTRVANSFNQMANALEKVEQQRMSLIGNVSHELRTPLTALQGYIEGLQDGLFPADADTFNAMGHDISRLRRLVDDLQELSRIEAGQHSIQKQPLNMAQIIQQTISQLQPQALAKSIAIDSVQSANNTPALGDPDRVAQILLNLVGNAIRYTGNEGQISIKAQAVGKRVAIDVTDNGIGIGPNQLPFVFERFYRVDSSRNRGSGGSGIGLTIAQHLAWSMDGELEAYSDGIGKGSRFRLWLPAGGPPNQSTPPF